MILSQEGTSYLFTYYDISPTIVTPPTVRVFMDHCRSKPAYKSYIKAWFDVTKTEAKQKVFPNPIFKGTKMQVLQPYFDLFTDFVSNSRRDEYIANVSSRDVTDASQPALWFPYARLMAPRRFIFHMGPTNSGKTRTAIEALQ